MEKSSNGAFLQSGAIGVHLSEISDGLSYTLMVGDKHVPMELFRIGPLDNSAYNGDYYLSHARPAGADFPLAQSIRELSPVFGSYHTAGVQFAFCDGSVRILPRSIPPAILGLLATRDDGTPIPNY